MKFAADGSRGVRRAHIRCPFHGMSWDLDGSLREIPCRWDFPHVSDDILGFDEIACHTWCGCVFIHMGADPPSLAEQLEVMPEHFRLWPMDERYVALHTEKVQPANWKMAMEALLEGFHVLETHAQAIYTAADANAQYDIFGRHVMRFIHAVGVPSPHFRQEVSEATLFGKLGRHPAAFPPGASARAEYAGLLREELGAAFGTALSRVSTSDMIDPIGYYLFPNAVFFPATGERAPPATPIRLGVEDSYTTLPSFAFAGILDQDTENLRLQRDGAKDARKGAQTLGNDQEARIRRLNLTLDEYLAG